MHRFGLKGLLAAVAALTFAASASATAVVPAASASIDWTTFGYQVFGLNGNTNPTFSFDVPSQSTNVYNNSTGDYSQDWSSPLSATEGVAFASASADALVAQFTSHPTVPVNNATAQRYGQFTLGSDAYVVFSVNAAASIDMNDPQGGDAYAWAYLTAEGPDMFGGPDTQSASTQKLVFANGLGNPLSQSGKLIASFSNLSGGDLIGTLNAAAITSSYGGTIIYLPVPEPGVNMMLLVGLALVGTMVSRRRSTPPRA